MDSKDHRKVILARIQVIRSRLDTVEAEKRDLLIRLDEAEGISTATGVTGKLIDISLSGCSIAVPVDQTLPIGHRERRYKGRGGRKSTTTLIVEFVNARPGLRPPAVADELADKITSRSKTPRRIVLNSITNLINYGELRKSTDGRLSLNVTAEPPSSMEGGK